MIEIILAFAAGSITVLALLAMAARFTAEDES